MDGCQCPAPAKRKKQTYFFYNYANVKEVFRMHKLLHRICAVMLSGSMLACGVPVSALPAAETEQGSSSLKEDQTMKKEDTQEKDEKAEISVQEQDPDHAENVGENENDTGNDTAPAVETQDQEEDNRISLYAAPSDKVVGITKFESGFVSGADEKDNGDLVWKALSSAKGHAFKWRLDVSCPAHS